MTRGPSAAYLDALHARRRHEQHEADVAAVHTFAEERRRAREAAASSWHSVQDRVHQNPRYLDRY